MLEEQEDFKKKRQEFSINIRKNNREQLLNKRRNLSNPKQQHVNAIQGQQNQMVLIVDDRYKQQIQQFIKNDYEESQFDTLSSLISSSDIMEQHHGLIGVRRLISRNIDPPINKFVDRNLIYTCILLAQQKQYPQLKLQAAWCLTNVASGSSEFCQKVFQKGGIQLFVNLLKENQKGIVDQAIWGIGNIAVDDCRYRDEILQKGGMQILIKVIQTSQNKTLIKNGTWAVTNLCRGNPAPKYSLIKEASPFLCKIIKSRILEANKQILSDAVWAISIMTEGNKSRIQKVHNENILHLLFNYANDNYPDLSVPALKTIGNFSNGNQNHAQALIDNGIFDLALALLSHPKRQVRLQICWVLSNMAAGVENQVKQFMCQKDLLDKIAILFNTDTVQIRKQICWIYCNFSHLGDRQTLVELCLHYDVMRIYANLLNQQDSRVLMNVLETLSKLLFVSKKCLVNDQNRLLVQLISHGGGQKLQNLQRHPNKKVYECAIRILTKFFQMEQDII